MEDKKEFEPIEIIVFCSDCKYCKREKIPKEMFKTSCESPLNKKEVLTFYEKTFQIIGRPSEINKNNDCEWFQTKGRVINSCSSEVGEINWS